jgi:hypothetical protein
MSYDIVLVPRREGQSWEEALRAGSADTRSREELREVWGRIESRLTRTLTGELDSWSEEADADGPTVGELSVTDSGLQVQLFLGQAAVSFPYWHQDDPDAFHQQVREAVRVVEEETGYAAFDPQTDSAFDGTFDDEPGIDFTRGLHDQPPASASASHAQVEPRAFYSGRRRAGTYLVIGAIVTVAAALWLTTGRGGTMSWVALAIGVADLFIGGMAWRGAGDGHTARAS